MEWGVRFYGWRGSSIGGLGRLGCVGVCGGVGWGSSFCVVY